MSHKGSLGLENGVEGGEGVRRQSPRSNGDPDHHAGWL